MARELDQFNPEIKCSALEEKELGVNDVHVWRVALIQPASTVESLLRTLSPDEVVRANRFHFAEHRERFIVGRGALRSILGHYLQVPPRDVEFVYNGYGKPSLTTGLSAANLRFNLSHSSDLALCACTRGREVGVDVEAVRAIEDAIQLAARYFDAPENATFQALPAHLQTEGFFVRWTLKEAYIKARGQGLSIPLDGFTIPSTPDATGFHCVHSSDPVDDARWLARRLILAPGYIGSLVVEGRDWRHDYADWIAEAAIKQPPH